MTSPKRFAYQHTQSKRRFAVWSVPQSCPTSRLPDSLTRLDMVTVCRCFFAFHKISRLGGQPGQRIRIFQFDIKAWERLYRADKLFPMWPNVSILNALAVGNPRAIPQQAISTFSNVDDIEAYLQDMEQVNKTTYLEAFDLPATERAVAMRELTLMGITAGSLFPGLDGACEALREQNFLLG